MSEDKIKPTHRISFSEKQLDGSGHEKLGQPVEVAVVWPRKEGKQGGIIEWHVSPEKLGNGVYFHLDNDRTQNRQAAEKDAFDQVDSAKTSRDQGLSR